MAMSSMVVNTIQKNLGVMLTRHDENYNGSRKLQKPFLGLSSFRQSSFSIIHSIRGPTFARERTTVAAAPTIAPPCQKKKLVFVMGSTGSGKSRLSIDIASHYLGEVINSDKMQVYKGLDIITNKMAESDRRGVPHHLIGEVEPDVDFTAEDFCMAATSAIERIVEQGRALVQNPSVEFKSRYEPCFIWLNVAPPILDTYLSKRVDDMRGIYRSIGVPEMDAYLRADRMVGYIERETLLKEAIDDIKANTCKLASKQVGKIETLRNKLGWNMHQIDTTPVFEKCGEEADAAWEMLVKKPTFGIIDSFLT
ncbi:hypothetical protein AAG906_018434 [Vitis piasezkii]